MKVKSSTNPTKPTSAAAPKARLVLHYDVNETLLAGDVAGGDTKEDCLNKMIAKNAFVQIPQQLQQNMLKSKLKTIEPTNWWDGTPIMRNNDELEKVPTLHTKWEWIPGCVPYYRTAFKKRAKTFTKGDGRIYRSLYHKLEQSLLLSDCNSSEVDAHISHDGKSHFLFPAFFHTIATLDRQKRDFTIVLRTFGSDLSDVAAAITAFAKGKHPDFPNFYRPDLIVSEKNMFRGRWKKNVIPSNEINDDEQNCTANHTYNLHKWKREEVNGSDCDTEIVASGDEDVLQLIETSTICGIQDDYCFWDKHDCLPQSGKPMWIRSHENGQSNVPHHIMFDDNIQNDPLDSIVGARFQAKGTNSFVSLTGEETQKVQGKFLVRVPTVEPILNIEWFLEQIQTCEKNVKKSNI